MVQIWTSTLFLRLLCCPQEWTVWFCVLIRHHPMSCFLQFRDCLISVFVIIINQICANTFLSIAKNLAFWTLCTGFDHIYRSQPKLTIYTFHPLSIWKLLFAWSMGPLSVMHLWIVPWYNLEDILLCDVRYEFSFRCCLSGGFLSPILLRSFTPMIR